MMSREPIDLEDLGWNRFFTTTFDALDDSSLVPARVGIEHNHLYRVYTRTGALMAHTAGKLRHAATGPEALPAVGDWVGVRISSADRATIREVLPRRNCFSRKAAGDPTKQQVVAANVDSVLLVSGLDGDFNLRRVERYLVAAAESGAAPVIVLNKADVTNCAEDAVRSIRSVAPDVPVHQTSCVDGHGLDQLEAYLGPGRTIALLGSSGVGKSTIINYLLGRDQQRTQAVRAQDSRGRHTTVHRELLVRAEGGVIIDTPGMRELQLWDTDSALESTFDAIERLADGCHFRNCQHRTEPGCAVREAVADGRLSAGRLEHYQQLHAERAVLNQRRDELAEMAERRRTNTLHRAIKIPNRRPKQCGT